MINIFKTKKRPENIESPLKHLVNLEKRLGELEKNVENLKIKTDFPIQKIGLIRYNPFKRTGSNQSFSLALLDSKDSGFIITSLYLQDDHHMFAKPLESGNSEYTLSGEEKEAIKRAKIKYLVHKSLYDKDK